MRVNNATGAAEALSDVLSDVKFSSTGWTPDDKACAPVRLQIPDIGTQFLADPTVADQLTLMQNLSYTRELRHSSVTISFPQGQHIQALAHDNALLRVASDTQRSRSCSHARCTHCVCLCLAAACMQVH